jgi:transposase
VGVLQPGERGGELGQRVAVQRRIAVLVQQRGEVFEQREGEQLPAEATVRRVRAEQVVGEVVVVHVLHDPRVGPDGEPGDDPVDMNRTGFRGDSQSGRLGVMGAPRRYPDEVRERAVRMVFEARRETGQSRGQIIRVGQQLGIPPKTLRNWVEEAELDESGQPKQGTQVAIKIAELERENRELRRANEILKSAATFFGAELDRHTRR